MNNTFTILGREYRLTTPDVRYPAIAWSHFQELNEVHRSCIDLRAAWNTLCVRCSNHVALLAQAAISKGLPIEGDVLLMRGKEWRLGIKTWIRGGGAEGAVSLTGDYQILADGSLAFSGPIERNANLRDFRVVEGKYRPVSVWFFVGDGVGVCRVQGAVWVKVFKLFQVSK